VSAPIRSGGGEGGASPIAFPPPCLRDERSAVVGGRRIDAFAADPAAWEAEVVVGVALHDQAAALDPCLASIHAQRGAPRTAVLVVDDGSSDDWAAAAGPLLARPGVVAVRARCGSAARARNLALDLADALFPAARWAARLDADDRLATSRSLAAACAAGDRAGARFVLGGNRLRRGGALLRRANPADERLRDPGHLLALLGRMADGTAENELPSCNLLLARGCGWRYPDLASAEDHWLAAELLLRHGGDGAILAAPFYCDYTLDGPSTDANRAARRYLRSRRALYRAAAGWAVVPAEPACC
jgi:glycosyltransferase involved in cell wall biosynthesis